MKDDTVKILIVDDEEVICDACSQILTNEGYIVETAHDGKNGLEKARAFKPSVMFVDLKMPGMSGLEVLDKVKEIDRCIIPVVITGYATIESAVDSMKHGAFEFLPKPFSPEELMIITKRSVQKHEILIESERLRVEKEHMRQNFISLVSHELRTPLVAVIQYMEVLSGGILGNLPPEQERIINRMRIRLNELLVLINRWLKFARIEDLDLKEGFKDFVLSTVIEESVEVVKPLAREKKLELTFESLPNGKTAYGDRDMIKEVITNIISNGIKYNRDGGSVTIEMRESNESLIVDISDTGIGMAEEEQIKVGDEFYRTKREGLAAGSGLGLAIVKKILDIHGGKLEIKSKLNLGSTFSVFLPKHKQR